MSDPIFRGGSFYYELHFCIDELCQTSPNLREDHISFRPIKRRKP